MLQQEASTAMLVTSVTTCGSFYANSFSVITVVRTGSQQCNTGMIETQSVVSSLQADSERKTVYDLLSMVTNGDRNCRSWSFFGHGAVEACDAGALDSSWLQWWPGIFSMSGTKG